MVTRRLWLSTKPVGGYAVREDGIDRPKAIVTVRAKGGAIPYDGVWYNGERSYDTYVIIDGIVCYHAPQKGLANWSFDHHEAAGGGHAP